MILTNITDIKYWPDNFEGACKYTKNLGNTYTQHIGNITCILSYDDIFHRYKSHTTNDEYKINFLNACKKALFEAEMREILD